MEPLQPAHVIEGSPVKFECIILGDALDVKWYVAGRDMTDDPKYQVSAFEEVEPLQIFACWNWVNVPMKILVKQT